MKKLSLLLPFLLLLFISSCSLFDREEELPAYIVVKNAKVKTGPNATTYTSLGLKDVWVNQTDLQGVYTLPTTFPVINLDKTEFQFSGGVHETGQSGFHVPYPFWETISLNLSLEPGDTFVLEPEFDYIDATLYAMPVEEDFEGTSIGFRAFNIFDDTAQLHKFFTDPFEGSTCGEVNFDANSLHFEVVSADDFSPDRNSDCYAEITYKTDLPLVVGLQYEEPGGFIGVDPIVVLTEKTEWNTVYVHLVANMRARPDGTVFKLWLKADNQGSNQAIYFDNIRVLHFE